MDNAEQQPAQAPAPRRRLQLLSGGVPQRPTQELLEETQRRLEEARSDTGKGQGKGEGQAAPRRRNEATLPEEPPASRKSHSMELHVELRTLSGMLLNLDVAQECTARELKLLILKKLKIPQECQKLLIDTDVLSDDVRLRDFFEECLGCLRVTLIVSVEDVCIKLAQGTDEEKLASLRTLERVGQYQKGNAAALAAVLARLDDPSDDDLFLNPDAVRSADAVRTAAFKILPKIADKGDATVIAAVVARFNNYAPNFRFSLYCDEFKAAAEVLPQLVEKGDAAVIDAVSRRLTDHGHDDEFVKSALCEILAEVAEKRDATAIAAVTAHLHRIGTSRARASYEKTVHAESILKKLARGGKRQSTGEGSLKSSKLIKRMREAHDASTL